MKINSRNMFFYKFNINSLIINLQRFYLILVVLSIEQLINKIVRFRRTEFLKNMNR